MVFFGGSMVEYFVDNATPRVIVKQVADFRPICCTKCLLTSSLTIQHALDAQQPQGQHGFPTGRRLEEHVYQQMSNWKKRTQLVF